MERGRRAQDPRLERAFLSLDGLSVGDAFGQRFFYEFDRPDWLMTPEEATRLIASRTLPPPPWCFTDDTVMASGVLRVLAKHGHVDQDVLAQDLAALYWQDQSREYGPTTMEILESIHSGCPWQEAAGAAYGGQGSMGNGAAMRVAPLGAFFADDLNKVVVQARASAEVTHTHAEGRAGAIAVAVAAAVAWRSSGDSSTTKGTHCLEIVSDFTPPGQTKDGIIAAMRLPFDSSVEAVAGILGNGSRVTAPDTVPFALWCAARHMDDYVEALWTTVSGLGDRDTTCAIVGGVVALATGAERIPTTWLAARESLGGVGPGRE